MVPVVVVVADMTLKAPERIIRHVRLLVETRYNKKVSLSIKNRAGWRFCLRQINAFPPLPEFKDVTIAVETFLSLPLHLPPYILNPLQCHVASEKPFVVVPDFDKIQAVPR